MVKGRWIVWTGVGVGVVGECGGVEGSHIITCLPPIDNHLGLAILLDTRRPLLYQGARTGSWEHTSSFRRSAAGTCVSSQSAALTYATQDYPISSHRLLVIPHNWPRALFIHLKVAIMTVEAAVRAFFASPRFAVAGASSDPSKFGHRGTSTRSSSVIISKKHDYGVTDRSIQYSYGTWSTTYRSHPLILLAHPSRFLPRASDNRYLQYQTRQHLVVKPQRRHYQSSRLQP